MILNDIVWTFLKSRIYFSLHFYSSVYPVHWPKKNRNVMMISVRQDIEKKIKSMFRNTLFNRKAKTILSIVEICNKELYDKWIK